MSVTINSPDDQHDLDALRDRVVAACDAIPPATWTAAELGAVVFVLECIVKGRSESIPDNVIALRSRRTI